MFVLGVLVGRGTAPVNFDIQALQKELLALKESMVKQEKRAMETDSAKTGAKSSFEFYEALKKKGKDEQIQIIEKKTLPKRPQNATRDPTSVTIDIAETCLQIKGHPG